MSSWQQPHQAAQQQQQQQQQQHQPGAAIMQSAASQGSFVNATHQQQQQQAYAHQQQQQQRQQQQEQRQSMAFPTSAPLSQTSSRNSALDMRTASPTPPSMSGDAHRRTTSMRPMSAFQPMESSSTHGHAGASPNLSGGNAARPPSPTGSTTRSIRTAAAPLTFRSVELRSALALQDAQSRKIYMEGYLSRRDDIAPDGKPLHVGDAKKRWHLCFVQLAGTVLSVWSVQQMEEAAREQREVPPVYINITDCFVDFIGTLTESPQEVPGSRGRYENVFAVNTAGQNRILFGVEGSVGRRLVQAWVNGIRLASWEKVRLEEIYTGALIRARLGASAPEAAPGSAGAPGAIEMSVKSPLSKGKMEGWVKARFMGSREWKQCWMILQDSTPGTPQANSPNANVMAGAGSKSPGGIWSKLKAGDRSSIMSLAINSGPQAPSLPDIEPPPGANGSVGLACFYETKKSKKPFATLQYAAHAFAVYPSRPELVEGSSLFKVEGAFGMSTTTSATGKIRQTGWVMIMPELSEGAASKGANAEMMKWVIAFMDAFNLYGRPAAFEWDARSPISPFFAYPIGPFKDRLFLDRELAEFLDIREERHLANRHNLHGIMAARMRGERTPVLPPLPQPNAESTRGLDGAKGKLTDENAPAPTAAPRAGAAPALPAMNSSLPPLDFGSSGKPSESAGLEAIGERSREGSAMTTATTPITSTRGHVANDPSYASAPAAVVVPKLPLGTSSPAAPSPPPKALQQQQQQQPGANPNGYNSKAGATPMNMTPGVSQERPEREQALSGSSAGMRTVAPLAVTPVALLAAEAGRSNAFVDSPISASTDYGPGGSAPTTASHANGGPSHVPSTSQHSVLSSTAYGAAAAPPPASAPKELPARVLEPSGRGAEEPSSAQTLQAPVPTSKAEHRMSDFGQYDEGALFYMNAMSDQLPAPTATTAPLVVQRSAPGTAPLNVPASFEAGEAPSSNGTHSTKYGTQAPASAPTAASTSHGSEPSSSHPTMATSIQSQAPPPLATQPAATRAPVDDMGEDALAAYSFLDKPNSPVVRQRSLASQASSAPSAPPGAAETTSSTPPALTSYPSTFGANKKTQERKEAAQAQQAAHHEAISKPGRPGVKKVALGTRPKSHAWGEESSEEDDEEDDEDDEELEKPQPPALRSRQPSSNGVPSRNGTPNLGSQSGRATPNSFGGATSVDAQAQQQHLQQQYYSEQQQRMAAAAAVGYAPPDVSQFAGDARSRSISPGAAQQRMRPGGPSALLQQQRQSVFNSHLAHNEGSGSNDSAARGEAAGRNTFVQLAAEEQPGAMTTVFQPHGLLQAGAQDKAERSAKQQEMDARMTGGHMVSVPNKPPPPQAGLLGAITAHERDRKKDGGYGATLTERERERVAAERRQREEDAVRQQQMQMMGGMMPGMMPGFNPMMWQQMQQMQMMGMMPQMMGSFAGGSQMGHPGASPPQQNMLTPEQMQMQAQAQMFAAQQAQHAYMQAMSQAGGGSMIGGEIPASSPPMGMGMPLQGGMPFNPYMSMYGAPMGFGAPSFMTPQPMSSEMGGVAPHGSPRMHPREPSNGKGSPLRR